MATTVVYGSTLNGIELGFAAGTTSASNATGNDLIGNLSTFLGGVTRVQQVNNSASTTNPNATFTNTPASGNAMIAIVIRGADNQASTNGSWTLLTSAGVSAARRLEIWWRRAGASESKTHTWTNGTSALWEVTMIECGGWASIVAPVVINAATNGSTTTGTSFSNSGPMGIGAVVTSGGSAGVMTVRDNIGVGVSYFEGIAALPITTTTRFLPFYADGYVNYPDTILGLGENKAFIGWQTSRPMTFAMVGWPSGSTRGASGNVVGIGQNVFTQTLSFAQAKMSFNTSSIPTANTVTSATLSLKSNPYYTNWPVNTSVNAYKITSDVGFSTSNSPTWWQTSSDIGGLTRVASRAASSTWAVSTVYDWTSDSAFPAQIVKGGTTSVALVTGDQAAGLGAARTSDNTCYISGTPGDHYLTIVHNLQATASFNATTGLAPTITQVAAAFRTAVATLGLTPAITSVTAFVRTVASSIDLTLAISRLATFARNIDATLGVTPAVERAATFARTIASTIGLTPAISTSVHVFTAQVPRILRLAGRQTVRLGQTVTARLTGRNTIRLPKENP